MALILPMWVASASGWAFWVLVHELWRLPRVIGVHVLQSRLL